MVHIFLGIIAIVVGILLMVNNWWAFLDLFWVVLPLVLILCGAIALVAGLTRNKEQRVTLIDQGCTAYNIENIMVVQKDQK